ncbi:MAG: hypothetical protein ACMXYF_04115 [Candidatus Woesearchaeota archaeon]
MSKVVTVNTILAQITEVRNNLFSLHAAALEASQRLALEDTSEAFTFWQRQLRRELLYVAIVKQGCTIAKNYIATNMSDENPEKDTCLTLMNEAYTALEKIQSSPYAQYEQLIQKHSDNLTRRKVITKMLDKEIPSAPQGLWDSIPRHLDELIRKVVGRIQDTGVRKYVLASAIGGLSGSSAVVASKTLPPGLEQTNLLDPSLAVNYGVTAIIGMVASIVFLYSFYDVKRLDR